MPGVVMVPSPFSCVVYKRTKAAWLYEYSHTCQLEPFMKVFPVDLCVESLQEYKQIHWLHMLLRQPLIVLVHGDTARIVSAAVKYKDNHDFLFYKSPYAAPVNHVKPWEELEKQYIQWELQCSLAVFAEGKLDAVHFFPCAMTVFPKVIRIQDLPVLQGYAKKCIEKAIEQSLWVCEKTMYREASLHKRQNLLEHIFTT